MQTYTVTRYGRSGFFAVRDATGALLRVCVTAQRAQALARRLQARDDAQRWVDTNGPGQEVLGPAVEVDPDPWRL